MKPDTKAFIFSEGGKILGDLARVAMSRPRKPTPGTESQNEGVSEEVATPTIQPAPAVALSASTGVVTRQGLDPETMRWQLQETRAELWELEGHLKNKCLDCGTPPTCCIKHALNLVDLARETKSMTTDPLWDDIIALAEEVKSKCHPDLIMAETYFDELPALVIRTSALRRQIEDQVIKNLKPELTLEEAKTLAAEEAAKEVESRWQSQEKKLKQ